MRSFSEARVSNRASPPGWKPRLHGRRDARRYRNKTHPKTNAEKRNAKENLSNSFLRDLFETVRDGAGFVRGSSRQQFSTRNLHAGVSCLKATRACPSAVSKVSPLPLRCASVEHNDGFRHRTENQNQYGPRARKNMKKQ